MLARAGIASRRASEELIERGRVRVNGKRAELGQKVDATRDAITVDGVRVSFTDELVYLALHKPAGVVTTASDPRRRQTVLDFVPKHPRVYPIGRLDKETSGLLLLTNDGDFALRVAHPRYGVSKTYVAEITGTVPRKAVARMRAGVELDDGLAKADSVKLTVSGRGKTLVEIVVREGRNRMVRRLLAAVGLELVSLTRTAVGPVRLGRLKAGDHRALTPDEVRALSAGSEPSEPID